MFEIVISLAAARSLLKEITPIDPKTALPITTPKNTSSRQYPTPKHTAQFSLINLHIIPL